MDFLEKLREAISVIAAAPNVWRPDLEGNRSIPMARFPFRVTYRLEGEFLSIVALAHAKRRPGYWRNRKFG